MCYKCSDRWLFICIICVAVKTESTAIVCWFLYINSIRLFTSFIAMSHLVLHQNWRIAILISTQPSSVKDIAVCMPSWQSKIIFRRGVRFLSLMLPSGRRSSRTSRSRSRRLGRCTYTTSTLIVDTISQRSEAKKLIRIPFEIYSISHGWNFLLTHTWTLGFDRFFLDDINYGTNTFQRIGQRS